jgi:hypothetical protein
MSDEQEYATGGYIGPPEKSGVQLDEGCWWWLPPREPDGSMRVKVHRGEFILRPVAVEYLLEQFKNGQWPTR